MEAANKSQLLQQRGCWEMLSLEEALASLERMAHPPPIENLTRILLKCRKNKNTAYALRLHAYIRKSGLEAHTSIGNYLVPMLVEVASMCEAQHVFDGLVDRNEHSWTSLITGYIECGELQHAFILYQKMQDDSVRPSGYTFVALLKACARLKDTERGQEIHAEIGTKGLLERYPFVGTALLDMYAKCGLLAKAREVFDELPFRDTISWTALVAGYAEHGLGQEALNCFEQMQLEGISPDVITIACSLKACGSIGAIDKGREIHSQIERKELVEVDSSVGNALIDMYVKYGLLAKAQEVFDRLPARDTISWNVLIAGYAAHGLCKEALNCFEQMQLEGVSPNVITFVCSLKACGNIGAIGKGIEIHAKIAQKALERDPFVGNTLVHTYAKCGLLVKAQEVFDKLPVRDTVSWNALITGNAEHGLSQEALNCFEQMQLEGISSDVITFVCILKACGSMGAIDKGQEIHAQIERKGLLERNTFVGSSLVDMYANCGLLAKAQKVFNKLLVRDAVSWNALIAGYAEQGLGQEALKCFEQMQLEGIPADAITFACSLKACSSKGAIDKGREIHAYIAKQGLLETDVFILSTVVDMYAKCGLLAKAQEVFNKLLVRDAVSWNALIAGYAEHGLGQEALNCFEQMHLEGISPEAVTFVCSLKACGSIGAIEKGIEIHAQMSAKGLLVRDPFIRTTLVDMYAKCGLLAKAQELFDKLPVRDAVSWNALIAGYAEHGPGQEALNCFKQMLLEGIAPDVVTYVCSLKACGSIGAVDKGCEIHVEIARKRLLERDSFVGNALVDMYAKCGSLAKAQEVFDKLPVQDAISWNALITGYAQNGLGQEALICFEQMQLEHICPDEVTFVCILKACGSMRALDKGLEIHDDILRHGLLESDPFVGSTLVDMYAKCGALAKAWEVLHMLPVRGAVSWNALITGYAQHGLGQEALNCFQHMQVEGVSPNTVTFVSVLKACGIIGAIDKGHEIHAEIVVNGLLERDAFVGSAVVDMFAKCGCLAKAQEVFDKLPVRDVVMWNALIAGYVEHELAQEAMHCFEQMQLEGVSPDAVTFVCSLKACGNVGAIEKGIALHAKIGKKGLSEQDPLVGSTLVDMYAKWGLLAEAQEVFDKIRVRDTVLWTAIVAGYAHLGDSEKVFLMLERMIAESIKPDGVTFLSVLTACSHTGLVDEGQTYIEAMSKVYGITPTIEHHTCMVDLLGRAGQLDKAVVMIKKMPFNPNLVLWHTMLGACRKWGDVELGIWAFEHAVHLDKKDVATYVLMSNIYADTHMQENAKY